MVDICIHMVPIYLEKIEFFICICGYLFGLGPHLLYLYPRLAAERHIRGHNYSYLLKSVSGDTEQNSNLYLYLLSVCNPMGQPFLSPRGPTCSSSQLLRAAAAAAAGRCTHLKDRYET